MKTGLKATIIIITYNGSAKIKRLLQSINGLPDGGFELVIINDGSTDDTEKIIRSYPLKAKYRLINTPNQGRAVSKNTGAALAKHEILWFIDDDMRMEPQALMAHLQHHESIPRSISVGTQIEDEPLMVTDIQKYKCHISRGWKFQIESASNPLSVDNLYMTSANVSMPGSLFRELGGFDERLKDAEDLDLAYRAWEAGVPVYYNANAVGYHLDLITCRSYVNRNRQYMEGYDILRNLKPSYMQINRRMHVVKQTGWKRMALSVVSQPLFVYLVDHFNIFKLFLPVPVRYRFYELLILGLGRLFPRRKLYAD